MPSDSLGIGCLPEIMKCDVCLCVGNRRETDCPTSCLKKFYHVISPFLGKACVTCNSRMVPDKVLPYGSNKLFPVVAGLRSDYCRRLNKLAKFRIRLRHIYPPTTDTR